MLKNPTRAFYFCGYFNKNTNKKIVEELFASADFDNNLKEEFIKARWVKNDLKDKSIEMFFFHAKAWKDSRKESIEVLSTQINSK